MIVNIRRHHVLASHICIANNRWTRARGLIGKKELPMNTALLIYPCRQIHTYFMRFPIDCLFIKPEPDSSSIYRVLKCIHSLRPWKVGPKVAEAWGVIELPPGTLLTTDIQENDFVRIDQKI